MPDDLTTANRTTADPTSPAGSPAELLTARPFAPVGGFDAPALEQAILARWAAEGVQARALNRSRPGKRPWVFYEGPPTANGRPGIHHVGARTVKDLFCRFKAMQGHFVDRRGGWDTHGLPVELEVEKQIGSRGKQDIERFGVAAFNEKCRDSVFTYRSDWERMTERMGFWVDLDRAYVTYRRDYIETEWAILKNFHQRGLLYEDYKISMHCTRCNTSLADHEVSQGMQEDVDDPSVWVKFRVEPMNAAAAGLTEEGDGPDGEGQAVSLLAWTTTPWTLGANVAIGLRPATPYAVVEGPERFGQKEGDRELYLVAEALVEAVFPEGTGRVLRVVDSDSLAGLPYEPVLVGRFDQERPGRSGVVITDEAVELTAGSGVLHIAPAYGDLEIGERHGLQVAFSVGRDGLVLEEVRAPGAHAPADYAGVSFKEADKAITADVKRRGLLYKSERIRHAYPFCWRDGTPLMFFAKTSWYVRTTAVKDALISNNAAVNWMPQHVRDGRFGQWLKNNVDWAISRERFWGCPLPIWRAEDGAAICVGSMAELEQLTGHDLKELDPHRPYIDDVVFERDGKLFRRVPDTIDVWFDSGAMPYAQQHWPFENEAEFEGQFPADFICEGMDQTRGWFYSLHAIATLLTHTGGEGAPAGPLADRFPDTSAFRNVVALGLLNDEQDRKMSKSRGNTVDPWDVFATEGCDPLRWYLLSAQAPGRNLAFKRSEIAKGATGLFLTLWNVYSFFVTYAQLSAPDLSRAPAQRPELDRWLDARLAALIGEVTAALEAFDSNTATRAIADFIDRDLSNWWLRLSRRRFWGRGDAPEAASAFFTLHRALLTVCQLMAPMAPFFSEAIWSNLARALPDAPDSVHLSDWPEADPAAVDAGLVAQVALIQSLTALGRAARAKANLKTRQPLARAWVRLARAEDEATLAAYRAVLEDELNVKAVSVIPPERAGDFVTYSLRPNFQTLGKRLGKKLNPLRQTLNDPAQREAVIASVLAGWDVTLTLDGDAETLSAADFLVDVQEQGGFATAFEGGYLLALETALDEALLEEGRLRDLLRQLQDARRSAGLEVSDRIRLGLSGDGAEAVVAAHGAALGEELLAVQVTPAPAEGALHSEPVSFGDTPLTATLARA